MGMNEQERRESVIKEFEDNYRTYSPGYAHVLVRNWAVHDAIDLLKAQEPRVMTLEEIRTTKPAMYIMYKSEDGEGYLHEYALFSRAHDGITEMIVADSNRPLVALIDSDYGKVWICWTFKPSNEQMKAVKWE